MSFYLVIILLMLLTVATYTWFSISQTPRVSDMNMYVNAKSGLELALGPSGEWTQQLDFRDMVDVTTVLRPITWSDEDQQFYAANYKADGRMTGVWEPLTDERNANKLTMDGYYIKATCFARSGIPANVTLSPAVEVAEGVQGSGTYVIGYPLWNEEEIVHNNGGLGGEDAIRIGIRVTPVNSSGIERGEAEFFIYEPNCNGYGGYEPTPSIDGAATLVDEEYLILQTQTYWSEAYPVQKDVVVYHMGNFIENPTLFELQPGEMVKLDFYIWLEGQDPDCTNQITGAKIMASIQFATDDESQSGLHPIY